jgi:hypothetical protein
VLPDVTFEELPRSGDAARSAVRSARRLNRSATALWLGVSVLLLGGTLAYASYSVPTQPTGARDFPHLDDRAADTAMQVTTLSSSFLFVSVLTMRFRSLAPGGLTVLLAFVIALVAFVSGFIFATPVVGPGGAIYHLDETPWTGFLFVWAFGALVMWPIAYYAVRREDARSRTP